LVLFPASSDFLECLCLRI